MLDQLEDSVRKFVLDVCTVMYNYGYSEVSVGAIMRLMGIDESSAAEHDNELVQLDEYFEKIMHQHHSEKIVDVSNETPPAGTTLH